MTTANPELFFREATNTPWACFNLTQPRAGELLPRPPERESDAGIWLAWFQPLHDLDR